MAAWFPRAASIRGVCPCWGGGMRGDCHPCPLVPPLSPPATVPTHDVSDIQEGLVVAEQQHAGGAARGGCGGSCQHGVGGSGVVPPQVPSWFGDPPALTSPVQGGSELPVQVALVGAVLGGGDSGQGPSLSWGRDMASCPATPQPCAILILSFIPVPTPIFIAIPAPVLVPLLIPSSILVPIPIPVPISIPIYPHL